MLLTNSKDWHGSLSIAGKNSAQKYKVLFQKAQNIQKNRTHCIFGKDLFTPDDSSNKYDDSNDDEIAMLIPSTNKDNKLISSKHIKPKLISPSQKHSNVDKLKYHNKHMKELKKKKIYDSPTCTKYNPNMNYIWAKSRSGPLWNTIRGRVHHISYDDKDFYLNHEDVSKTNMKVYIDMKKQTMRNGFPMDKDVRVRYEKKFKRNNYNNDNKENINNDNNTINNNYNNYNSTFNKTTSYSMKHFFKKPNNPNNNNNNNSETPSRNDIPEIKRIPSMSKIHPLSTKNLSNIISLSFPGKNIPDFSKTLSRDQLTKIEQRNVIDVPYRSPDIAKIKDRSVMMVQYDKTNYYNKQPTYKPEAPIDYNVDKVYNKINNNKQPSTPNFSLMISRPEYGVDPLPSFMKKIYTRASSFTTTDKTLMMNSFAMSEYLGHYSSFFPKRSYNKNINLALLNSDKVDIGLIENKSEFNKLANFVTKTTFYNKKDIGDMIKENNVYKFDNVTFKHVKYGRKIREDNKESNIKKYLKRKYKNEKM